MSLVKPLIKWENGSVSLFIGKERIDFRTFADYTEWQLLEDIKKATPIIKKKVRNEKRAR